MEKIIKELEQKKVELLKEVETIDKAIKTLSKKDISPAEKWLFGRIDGCVPETRPSGNVEWWKDGRFLFEQNFKNGVLWVNYSIIWKVLEEEFGINYNDSKELIKNVMYDYTNNGSLTPTCFGCFTFDINVRLYK